MYSYVESAGRGQAAGFSCYFCVWLVFRLWEFLQAASETPA